LTANNDHFISGPASSTTHHLKAPSVVQRLGMAGKVDTADDTIGEAPPPREWTNEPEKRAEMLRKRKEFMVLQARKKFLEKQANSNAAIN